MRGVKREFPDYHCHPVAPFGRADAKVLVAGLAPGKHGANATGRAFTGDASGALLYATLHRFGFCSNPVSEGVDDGLKLVDCRITNVVKCLPPDNKPLTTEINACNRYLSAEIDALSKPAVIVGLGGIAHKAVLKSRGLTVGHYRFGHLAEHELEPGLRMVDSYHCSRYNTQTGRLTVEMFEAVFARVREIAG